jgi:hypothetical protein
MKTFVVNQEVLHKTQPKVFRRKVTMIGIHAYDKINVSVSNEIVCPAAGLDRPRGVRAFHDRSVQSKIVSTASCGLKSIYNHIQSNKLK